MERAASAAETHQAMRSSANTRPVVIVDDNPYDAMQAEGIIEELEPSIPAQILTSGEDFIAYLQGEGLYQDRTSYPYPGLVLLDLKMPKMDGFEVLQWLKNHPQHAKVPIVVLSGFADMVEQVTRAYSLGAHSFLPKPIQRHDIESILSLLKISI
jgi:CheY-like chemotaxis protein